MRLLADLAEDDVKWLDARAAELGLSRAALLREAVAVFRAAQADRGLEGFLGLWARQGSAVDGLAYERRLRSEPGSENGVGA